MSLLNKRYCSHCGTPNSPANHTCSKCGKPIASALRDHDEEEVVVKKRPSRAARVIFEDDENEFADGIAMPDASDVVIQARPKLTIGSLHAGAQVPDFADSRPSDIEVTSKAYFHQEKLD